MKKIVALSILSVILAVLCLPAGFAETETPHIKRGVLTYEEIIAPQYEDARPFSDGLAAVV